MGHSDKHSSNRTGVDPLRTIVLQPVLRSRGTTAEERDPEVLLEETAGLARAISLDIVSSRAVSISRPRPGTLFGPGVVAEIHDRIEAEEAGLVVVGGGFVLLGLVLLELSGSLRRAAFEPSDLMTLAALPLYLPARQRKRMMY